MIVCSFRLPSLTLSQVNRNVHCSVLCRKKYSAADVGRLADFALLDYRANMCAMPLVFVQRYTVTIFVRRLDNLPLAEMVDVVQEDGQQDTE